MDRRLVPEHQLSPEQERDLERQSCRPGQPRGSVRDGDRPWVGRDGARAAAQARHGREVDRHAPGALPGECAGSAQFTHVSFDDFRIIRDNLAGGSRTTRDRLIPFCLFTDPPLARVGLNERDARRRGVEVRIATLPMSAVLRTRTIAETQGFMKALVDAQSDRILGFTMLGPEAGEVMAVVQTAMLAGMPYPGLRDAILTHPTMAEGLGALFATVPPKAAQLRADA
jgi:hypothetical protein